MHHVDEGSGPPVVLVHGNPSWSFLFRGVIPALAGGHRVIAPDHLGCGLSDLPPPGYHHRLAERVDDLAELLDMTVPGEPVDLV
ncbi:MAG: alpha/beta fold hydrolase, partial [Planctomycetota bacterium]